MPSYQDIETRLRVVEEKVDLLMRSIKINKVEGLVDKKVTTKSLLEIYHEMKWQGTTAAQLAPEQDHARESHS
jgi:hypothetical protein